MECSLQPLPQHGEQGGKGDEGRRGGRGAGGGDPSSEFPTSLSVVASSPEEIYSRLQAFTV